MSIAGIKLGTKLEMEFVNSLGQKIGQTYISQLIDIQDDKNIIIAAPIHESRLMLISTGTRVRIVLLHPKQGLLGFFGFVVSRDRTDNLITIHIRIDSDFEKIQRRNYFRLECLLNATYSLCPDEDENGKAPEEVADAPVKKAIAKNVSGSGACIVVEDSIHKGAVLKVSISLDKSTTIEAKCRVMRSSLIEGSRDKKHELGLYFEEINKRDQDAIIKYVFDQQRQRLKNSNG